MEVLTVIGEQIGNEFILGVCDTADEVTKGGISYNEGIEISKIFKASGQVDFLNVTRARIDTDPGLTDVIPIMGVKNSPHLDFAGEVHAATNFPSFHAAKNKIGILDTYESQTQA